MKATYLDPGGYAWDYYGDDENPNLIYIIPKPQYASGIGNIPVFSLTEYEMDKPLLNGSGYFAMEVELSVPDSVQQAIKAQLPTTFPKATAPEFGTLAYNPGGKVFLSLTAGNSTIQLSAPVSAYGSNVAVFTAQLTQAQLNVFQTNLSGTGSSACEVTYNLSVPARLPAVTATLSFDSSVAYQYQVTQPSYNSWGDETSPGSVQQFLQESNSSKIDITWGEANPPASLQQAVANWANATLADLVQAEVKKVIALQGIQSDRSFSLNEVSSFTSVYEQNTVVNWVLSPTDILPTMAALNVPMNAVLHKVNERQQQMSLSMHLPFSTDDAQNPNIPITSFGPALVDHVNVTVHYPTLNQSQSTYTFTSNAAQIFTAPFADTTAWSFDYEVVYKGAQSSPVTGTISTDLGSYTLELEEAGILYVLFDASQAFGIQGTKPTSVDIRLTFVNSAGMGQSVDQLVTIRASQAQQAATVASFTAVPLNTTYNYTVTYHFPTGPSFTAPTVQNATGLSQSIPAAAAAHQTNVLLYVPQPAPGALFFGATANVWYSSPPDVPNIPGQPTEQAPAVIQLNPSNPGSPFVSSAFYGFINGNQPLMYSASINSSTGQIDIDAQAIENDQASIMISPTQRYYTIILDPTAINWNSASFQSVEVLVTPKISSSSQSEPQKTITWNKNESDRAYITVSCQVTDTVSYSWTANYITPGQPIVSTKVISGVTDTILNIPANVLQGAGV